MKSGGVTLWENNAQPWNVIGHLGTSIYQSCGVIFLKEQREQHYNTTTCRCSVLINTVGDPPARYFDQSGCEVDLLSACKTSSNATPFASRLNGGCILIGLLLSVVLVTCSVFVCAISLSLGTSSGWTPAQRSSGVWRFVPSKPSTARMERTTSQR